MLENDATVFDCNLKKGAVLHLGVLQVLRFKMPDGAVKLLSVEASDTVGQVKALIAKNFGVPPGQQRLVFMDTRLKDGKTLEQSEILDGVDLHLVVEPTGA